MSNNKQTDIAELAIREYPFSNSERNAFIAGYNKAKEMHKQESIAAQMDMFHHLNNLPFGMQYLDKRESAEQFAEKYYKETFGGNNEQL